MAQLVTQQPPEPSGLLVAVVLFGIILGWIAFMGAIAMLRQHGIGWVVQAVGRGVHLVSSLLDQFDRPAPRLTISDDGDGTAQQNRRPSTRRRRLPIRRRNGQLAGSKSVPNGGTTSPNRSRSVERSSTGRTASESDGTTVSIVPQNEEIVLTVPEMLVISIKLSQGMAPSDVAKSLPGYRGGKYNAYMEKVRRTQATLAEIGMLTPSEEPKEP